MILKRNKLRNGCWTALILLLSVSCGLFTFSDVSLSPDIRTFSVLEFEVQVADGPMDMSKKLSELLESRLLQMTSLERIDKEGDLQYEGSITGFTYLTTFSDKDEDGQSIEIQRLTITIEVTCLNTVSKEDSFKRKSFSASADTKASEDKSSSEPTLVDEIFTKLVTDICRKSVDNW